MNFIKRIIIKQKIKLQLGKVVEVIYSDTALFSTEKEQENFINQLSKSNSKIDLLVTYLAVEFATRNVSFKGFYEAVNRTAIDEIFDTVEKLEKYSEPNDLLEQNNSALDLTLNLHRLKANRLLHLVSFYFEKGRTAYKENPNSFEGMRYIQEKNNKKPLSLNEQKNLKKNVDKIHELDNQINHVAEQYENKLSELRAQAALDKIIQEVKEENSSKG